MVGGGGTVSSIGFGERERGGGTVSCTRSRHRKRELHRI